jgi:hypothetical protein
MCAGFFPASGSKILVASYVHLRREGLDGYIADFNNMVRDVWGVTGTRRWKFCLCAR